MSKLILYKFLFLTILLIQGFYSISQDLKSSLQDSIDLLSAKFDSLPYTDVSGMHEWKYQRKFGFNYDSKHSVFLITDFRVEPITHKKKTEEYTMILPTDALHPKGIFYNENDDIGASLLIIGRKNEREFWGEIISENGKFRFWNSLNQVPKVERVGIFGWKTNAKEAKKRLEDINRLFSFIVKAINSTVDFEKEDPPKIAFNVLELPSRGVIIEKSGFEKDFDNPVYPTSSVEIRPIFNNAIDWDDTQKKVKQYINDELLKKGIVLTNSIGGKIIISKDGEIMDVAIFFNKSPEINSDIVEVIKKMPKWKPGEQNGKTVRTNYGLWIDLKKQ